jgi:hypothetical protein
MIKILKKEYLLLLFLTANLTAEYSFLMSISKVLFYVTLAVSFLFCVSSFDTIIKKYRTCKHVYILVLIYILYQFTVGISYVSLDAMLYLLSKCVVFGTMVLCINKNFSFYFRKVIRPFAFIILGLLILGYVVHPLDYAGNMAFGFINRNAGTAMATISFAGFLFTTEKFKYRDYLILTVLLAAILMGGSRNSFAMCLVLVLIRYRISSQLIIASLAGLVLVLYIFPYMGLSVEAFDRVMETLTNQISLDRETQREAALWMIKSRPETGWGFEAQMQGYAAELTELGSHNGYLDHLMFMGIYFGALWILVLLLGAINRLKLFSLHDNFVNYHLAVMLAVLLGANNEAFLVGVNQITTNIFYVSYVLLGVYIYRYGYRKHQI